MQPSSDCLRFTCWTKTPPLLGMTNQIHNGDKNQNQVPFLEVLCSAEQEGCTGYTIYQKTTQIHTLSVANSALLGARFGAIVMCLALKFY